MGTQISPVSKTLNQQASAMMPGECEVGAMETTTERAGKIFHLKESPISDKVSEPAQAYQELKDIGKLDQETFWILGLNANNQPMLKEMIFMGGLQGITIDPRVIFKRLLVGGCTSFICAHNHPSGNKEPSREDKAFTNRLKEAGELLGLPLIDHLVITDDSFVSLQERGHL